mgnify:CR=1 FL=1
MESVEHPISESLFAAACGWVIKALSQNDQVEAITEPELLNDTQPRVAILTVADTNAGQYLTRTSHKSGLLQALNDVIAKIELDAESFEQVTNIKLDIVTHIFPLNADRVQNRHPLISDRSLVGFMLGDYESAWLPEESVRFGLFSRKGKLNRGRILDALGADRITNVNSNNAWCFATRSRSLLDGADLFRGKALRDVPAEHEIEHIIAQAKHYLCRATKDTGKFVYAYDAASSQEQDDYNILRHAGSLWSMCEIYQQKQDNELANAIHRAAQYLENSIEIQDKQARVLEKGYVKLGGNGLALVALSSYYQIFNASADLLEKLQGLAQWIVATQSEEGQFTVHKQRVRDDFVMPFVSDFYPGEAILGLVALYRLDHNQLLLDAANNAANWLINIRDKDKPIDDLQRDHWLLYAITALYNESPQAMLAEQSQRLATKIMRCQNSQQPTFDWNGGWKTPPMSTTTACMCEGLSAAYKLAVQISADTAYLHQLKQSIERGLQNQRGYQFDKINSAYLQNPAFAEGGFICDYDRWLLRIDYTQHSVMSFLNYKRWVLPKN